MHLVGLLLTTVMFAGAENFPAEANAVLEQLVQGQVLQAEVVGQEDDGVPYVQLYILKNSRVSHVHL